MKQRIYTVATAHLDTVWDWTFETTVKEYIYRTLRDNFNHFEKYPNYRFSFEGAYRYELMEEYYPELFEKLKGYVADGRWNVAGSSYENGDVNVPSPEALFRNILYGNSYFDKKFGKRSKDIYLPDCFGFGWALPSIAHHANLLGFTTQKLSWGSAYGNPFDIGKWRGVDGNYIFASLQGGSYTKGINDVRDRQDVSGKLSLNKKYFDFDWTFLLYGAFDDRGGAPEPYSIETVEREISKNDTSESNVLSSSTDQIFRDLENELTKEQIDKLPEWNNELLMSDHAVGGYTSRAIGKRWNRRNELLADMAERSACTAEWVGAMEYPREKFETAWKRVIAHQFHDDIPGTSLFPVYKRSWNDYILSLNQFAEEYRASVSGVARSLNTCVEGIPVIVNNPVETFRKEAVEARVTMAEPCKYVRVYHNGKEVPSQIKSHIGRVFEIVFTAEVPAIGYAVFDVRPSDTPCDIITSLKIDEHALENEFYAVCIDNNGDISSIIEKKSNHELLSSPVRLGLYNYNGSANWPAWELNYDELSCDAQEYAGDQSVLTPYRVVFTVIEDGPSRVALKIYRHADYQPHVPRSSFTQIVSLDNGSDFIRVENEVDWNSERRLLKVEFPLSSSNPTASYDLGLGVIERGNRTRQLHEVPAQLWADITDKSNEFGVSVFSDSKSGWDKPTDNKLRLTAIHTPMLQYDPDWHENRYSDQSLLDVGLNRFGFGIFFHNCGWQNGTQLAAKCFAQPLAAFQTVSHDGILGTDYSFGSISDSNILVRAIKKAENTDEVIVRFNEGAGRNAENVRFTLGDGIESAREVFASEEKLGEASVVNGELVFSINRYEPKTFALKLKAFKSSVQKANEKALDLPYNLCSTTYNSQRFAASLDGNNQSIPAELFPETITCGNISFKMGSKEAECKNALIANGQEIKIPSGYKTLYFLACSLNGDKNAVFTLDGDEKVIRIQDYQERIGAWDLYSAEETGYIKRDVLAWNATHTHCPTGDNVAKHLYIFRYKIELNGNEQTLKLPIDSSIAIFAATASDEKHTATATQLYDSLEKREFFYSRLYKLPEKRGGVTCPF